MCIISFPTRIVVKVKNYVISIFLNKFCKNKKPDMLNMRIEDD